MEPRAHSPSSRSPKRGWGASCRHDLQPFMLLLQLDECLVFFSQLTLKILHFLRRSRGVVTTAIRAYTHHTNGHKGWLGTEEQSRAAHEKIN